MSKSIHTVAVDLGASGGKVILGSFDGNRIKLKEIYRFPNGMTRLKNNLYWDVLRLFEEIKKGLSIAGNLQDFRLASLGIDTWGNDCCLLDKDHNLLENPHTYRDPRTDGIMEKAFDRMPREEIYRMTGVQFIQTNTLFQLYSLVLANSPLLSAAGSYLMMPDLFNFWLTGEKCCEFTDATTTQFADPNQQAWCLPILEAFDIPTGIMPPIIKAGTRLGNMDKWLSDELNIKGMPVIAVGTHDTASAVSVIPAPAEGRAFLSSGTWSLLGAEVKAPLINSEGFKHNFSCYGGVCDTFLVWKNIQGLWLLQECQRNWKEEGTEYPNETLISLAEQAKPFGSFIDPDDLLFLQPGHFPSRIDEYCIRTGQKTPKDKGAVVRCILESLALKYRLTFENLQKVLGHKLSSLYIIGGGSRNQLLNQFTADALEVPVWAGLPEATSLGNILSQLISLGEVGSLEESRQLVSASFDLTCFKTGIPGTWNEAYQRYLNILAGSHTYNF